MLQHCIVQLEQLGWCTSRFSGLRKAASMPGAQLRAGHKTAQQPAPGAHSTSQAHLAQGDHLSAVLGAAGHHGRGEHLGQVACIACARQHW